MMKYIYLFLIALLCYSVAVGDFLEDKSIKGVVARSSLTTIVSSQLDADSNGTYQGRQIVFVSANKNINFAPRLTINFYADYDSLLFDPPLLVAPSAGDSFYIFPIFSFDMIGIEEATDSNRKAILASPYTPIKTYSDGSVYSLADIILAARPGWRIWYFPQTINPKDSAWVIDPSQVGSSDSVYARIYYPKNFNVTKGQKFDIY